MSVAAGTELNKLGRTRLSVGSAFRAFRRVFERLSCFDTHSCAFALVPQPRARALAKAGYSPWATDAQEVQHLCMPRMIMPSPGCCDLRDNFA